MSRERVCERKSYCLGTLYLLFNQLKSGFSKVDFGSLLIDNCCPPPCLGPCFPGVSYWLITYPVMCINVSCT